MKYNTKRLKIVIYLWVLTVNIAPLFIYRLYVGRQHGDEQLVYVMFALAIILSSLLYLPLLLTNEIKRLRRFLFLPSVFFFVIGTIGNIAQINEDGEFYLSSFFNAYIYFIINFSCALGLYQYYKLRHWNKLSSISK